MKSRIFNLFILLAGVLILASVGCGTAQDVAEDNNGDVVGEVDENEDGPICGDGILDDAEECDDGDDQDGDGCSSECLIEEIVFAGLLDIELTVDDLNSREAPLVAICEGELELSVFGDDIEGEGSCALPANFMTMELEASLEGGDIEGKIVITFNAREHVLALEGSRVGDRIELSFEGVTLATANVRLLWDGVAEVEVD